MGGRLRRGERGQATVEFALLIPVLLLIFVGLIEFGTAFNYKISLNHIAGDGARWASVNRVPGSTAPATLSGLKTSIASQGLTGQLKDEIAAGGVYICFIPANPAATAPTAGDAVKVKVTAPHSLGLVFTSPISVDLVGRATMRLEQTPPVDQTPGVDPDDTWVICAPPESEFTASPTTGQGPLLVQFTDMSSNAPTSWAWDFDNDGTIDSNLRNPTYSFPGPTPPDLTTTYTVTLTAGNEEGAGTTETKVDFITVNAP